MNETEFSQLWYAEEPEGLFDGILGRSDLCPYAQKFSEWANGLLLGVSKKPDIVSVNQAKVLLQDKWHDWRTFAPKLHRNYLSYRGHTCLFQVYEQAYKMLRVLELSLTPPLLFLPPKPRRQVPQIFLGDEA